MKEFLSRGLYNMPDASRILRLKQDAVRRWAFGYDRRGRYYPGVTPHQVPDLNGHHAITFLELVQLLSVKEFLEAGASWKLIREAYESASKALDATFPFARDNWFADPAGIYHQGEDESGVLTEMSSKGLQTAMKNALAAYLHEMDFDPAGHTNRWYPLGKSQPVVLDPGVAFGSPVVKGTGIRTDTLLSLRSAGEDVDSLAWWYGIEPYEVEAALDFEKAIGA